MDRGFRHGVDGDEGEEKDGDGDEGQPKVAHDVLKGEFDDTKKASHRWEVRLTEEILSFLGVLNHFAIAERNDAFV